MQRLLGTQLCALLISSLFSFNIANSVFFDSIANVISPVLMESEFNRINSYVTDICEDYPRVDESLVKAIIFHESGYVSEATNYDGSCVGLMQVSPYWNSDRAEKLGVDDFMDPYSNILVGVDCIDEYLESYDLTLSLMLYGMNHNEAYQMYELGLKPRFVDEIFDIAQVIEKGESEWEKSLHWTLNDVKTN